MVMDTSLGAHGRKERADETCVQQAGHVLRAHPWQVRTGRASGATATAALWSPSVSVQGTGYKGPAVPTRKDTEQRVELAMLAQREWLNHAVRSCVWNNGVRRL